MKPAPRNVTPAVVHAATVVEAHHKARRVVLGHFFFFLFCVVLALIARRFLKFPPQLSWVVFAIFGLVFAGDLCRLAYRNFQLQRLRAASSSPS
ncbi:MAG: hypothetical protein H7343_04595 [Undibacterium sp.]|nr:hypothetical protein [Opitutaceae bacterium]